MAPAWRQGSLPWIDRESAPSGGAAAPGMLERVRHSRKRGVRTSTSPREIVDLLPFRPLALATYSL
jgi:hypothetical protein